MAKKKDTLKDILAGLEKEYFALGRARVNPWDAWLVILLASGILLGVVVWANGNPDFVLDCDYEWGACGGLWTHTSLYGNLGVREVSNVIGAMPAVSVFMLGFVSSALIFGLIWDKFSYPWAVKTMKTRKRRVSRKNGYISRELLTVSFLAILLALIFSSPAADAIPPPLPPHISAFPAVVDPGASVTVYGRTARENILDWVGLYNASSPEETGTWENLIDWQYLNGEKIPPASSISDFSLAFTIPDNASSTYHFRLFADDGPELLAVSNNVVATSTNVSPVQVQLSPSGPAGGNVIAGSHNQPLASFDVNVSGEAVVAKSLKFKISTSVYGLIDLQIFDQNGIIVAGPFDPVSDTVTFTDWFTIPIGKSTYTIKGNIITSFSSQTFNISTLPSADWVVVGQTSGNLISVSPNSTIYGPTFRVIDKGSFSVVLDPLTPSGGDVLPGSVDVPLTILKLSASDEGIRLNQINLQFDGSNVNALWSRMVTLWDGANQVGVAFFPTGRHATSSAITNFVIPKDGSKRLTIRGTISNTGVTDFAREGDTISVNYDGQGVGNEGVGSISGLLIKSSSLRDTVAPEFTLRGSGTTTSAKFQIGDRVKVTAGALNVRSYPGLSSPILGVQFRSDFGQVTTIPGCLGGPTGLRCTSQEADGFIWWYMDYDNSSDGWSVENFLVEVNAGSP